MRPRSDGVEARWSMEAAAEVEKDRGKGKVAGKKEERKKKRRRKKERKRNIYIFFKLN